MKKYVAERTNKVEIRPKEQSEKAKSRRENLMNEIQLKGHKRKLTQEHDTKERTSSVGLCQKHKPQHLQHVKASPWGRGQRKGPDALTTRLCRRTAQLDETYSGYGSRHAFDFTVRQCLVSPENSTS